MARWRLLNPHYIKIPGTEWEHREQDLGTGENNVMRVAVPRFLDPAAQRDCRSEGECVVCLPGKGSRGDWAMEGPPTPDMAPLDEEAQLISDAWAERWKYKDPVEALPAQGQSYLPQQPQAQPGVDAAAFKSVQEQVAALMEQNAKLAELVKAQAEPKAARRA